MAFNPEVKLKESNTGGFFLGGKAVFIVGCLWFVVFFFLISLIYHIQVALENLKLIYPVS